MHLEFPEHHQTCTFKTIDARTNRTGFIQTKGDRQIVGLFQLTD